MTSNPNRPNQRIGVALLILGLVIALTAALLLVVGVLESGWAAAMGMLGIGLIATSRPITTPPTRRE
jgi:hypothetical protein